MVAHCTPQKISGSKQMYVYESGCPGSPDSAPMDYGHMDDDSSAVPESLNIRNCSIFGNEMTRPFVNRYRTHFVPIFWQSIKEQILLYDFIII